MRSDFARVVHCVICGDVLTEERLKKRAITCSPEHSKDRANQLRRMLDAKRCRYCQRPATQEEQARFRRWRAWEKLNPPTPEQIEASTITPQEETSDGKEAVPSVD